MNEDTTFITNRRKNRERKRMRIWSSETFLSENLPNEICAAAL